jgi:hypothetical protein
MQEHDTHDGRVRCQRCGREGASRLVGAMAVVPEGWEGTIHDAVCAGCQYAEWHPLCESILTWDGERVDRDRLAAMPRDEWKRDDFTRYEYLDLTVSVIGTRTRRARSSARSATRTRPVGAATTAGPNLCPFELEEGGAAH